MAVVAGGTGADERPRFVEQEAPSDVEVGELLSELAKRVTKMLHAHGRMLDDESEEEPEPQLLFAGRPARTVSEPQREEVLPARCALKEGYTLARGPTGPYENEPRVSSSWRATDCDRRCRWSGSVRAGTARTCTR